MQQRYLGSKRFSLEGSTALIPLVDEVLDTASRLGAIELVMGMSHRGRLNVIAHVAQRPPDEIFAGFEDVDPRSVLGSGDVKYHMGATGEYTTRSGGKVHIHLVSNPSHLEAVDPVTIGRTRAKQDRTGEGGREKYLPLVGSRRRRVRRTRHPRRDHELRRSSRLHRRRDRSHHCEQSASASPPAITEEHSTRFAACIARRQSIPIFHVNGEDVDAVVRVARIATEYRYKFGTDVVIDLIGYRRHGHSEVDDPTITQPLLYKKIKDHPPLWEIYADDIGATDAQAKAEAIRAEFDAAQKKAGAIKRKPTMRDLPKYWDQYYGGLHKPEFEVETGLAPEELSELTTRLTTYPAGFNIHPKVKKLLEQRAEMGAGKRAVDYGMAEALAFGSLVKAGVPCASADRTTRRGTFNQRHSVLIDIENENEFVPLENIAPGQARCEIYNSTLSEAGVLGFEYGYSRDYPESLVLWEAQFGDFVNVAQAIIDQFISAGEAKWNLLSGVVMLLPHGYEGQGPEHSSARIERFIQLAAKHNIQIAQPRNAAQYFHLLRRQALRHWRKPLVVFTPKSMLRHPDASLADCRLHAQELPERYPRHRSRRSRPHPDLHRKNRPRTPGRTQEKKRHHHRDRLPGTALSISRAGSHRRIRPPRQERRHRLGAGRARQHGRLVQHAAAPEAHRRRPACAERKTQLQRQPRDGQHQSARSRAEDAADAGLHHQGIDRSFAYVARRCTPPAMLRRSVTLVLNRRPCPAAPTSPHRHRHRRHLHRLRLDEIAAASAC